MATIYIHSTIPIHTPFHSTHPNIVYPLLSWSYGACWISYNCMTPNNRGTQFLWIGLAKDSAERILQMERAKKWQTGSMWDTTRDRMYPVVNKTTSESFSIESILCCYHLGDCQADTSLQNGKCSTYHLSFIGELSIQFPLRFVEANRLQ